jgi:hypothetical protein
MDLAKVPDRSNRFWSIHDRNCARTRSDVKSNCRYRNLSKGLLSCSFSSLAPSTDRCSAAARDGRFLSSSIKEPICFSYASAAGERVWNEKIFPVGKNFQLRTGRIDMLMSNRSTATGRWAPNSLRPVRSRQGFGAMPYKVQAPQAKPVQVEINHRRCIQSEHLAHD